MRRETALNCDSTTAHGEYSEVGKCIDTRWCSVCGLLFDGEALVAEHAGKSDLCRLNLFLRGAFLDESSHDAALSRRTFFRRTNLNKGVSQGKVAKLCVRTFGPHQCVFNEQGGVVVPSKKGHPLGPNRPLHLPSGLLCPYLDAVPGCQASRYRTCTDACLICRGLESGLNG